MFVSIVCKLQCIVPTVYKRLNKHLRKQAVREAATTCPRLVQVEFCPFDLKVVSESRVTWATSVPILVFLGLSVLDLGPMYATDRRQTRIIA